jgi:hypothetical protein
MFEVTCPSCAAAFEYNDEDYIHLCPYCSAGFVLDIEEGAKDLIGDNYIVPNQIEKEQVSEIFYDWIKTRYHRPERIKNEFKVLGTYGISIPYWIVSLEAHTYWSGHSQKAKNYSGQPARHDSKFVKEEGRFSRRYRWAILARKSPKEHWGLERLHQPKERILVDWDGFPLDESMGRSRQGTPGIYDAKQSFNFDHANGLPVAGIQVKESKSIARAKDQINEYHRRICKTKVGTLYEHRTEIEVVGIQVIHIPFWFVRYAFIPGSAFRFFTTVRERRLVLGGYTSQILEAEMPLSSSDKVMTNLIVCGGAAIGCLAMAVLYNSLFFLVFIFFVAVCVLSAWRIFSRDILDLELTRGKDNAEPSDGSEEGLKGTTSAAGGPNT